MSSDYNERQKALEERIKTLIINVINLTNRLPRTVANLVIIKQLIRSITSLGANYREACEPESKNDFSHKMSIAKKELSESLYWIELLAELNPKLKPKLRDIYKEAHEIFLIFAKAVSTAKNGKR